MNSININFYRFVNAFIFGPYSVYSGIRYKNFNLIAIGFILSIVDIWLIYNNIKPTQTLILQPLRFLGFAIVGPYWIYSYSQYKDRFLLAMGMLQIITDGWLFIIDLSRKNNAINK